LSWLPVVGDPLCAVAGWLRLPFWPCVGYMAIGKFARYVTMTAALLWVFPGRFTPCERCAVRGCSNNGLPPPSVGEPAGTRMRTR
jgi:hypothetical protein